MKIASFFEDVQIHFCKNQMSGAHTENMKHHKTNNVF